jgi:hypothetical protein
MQVSVETTQGLERRLTISVPAEQIEKLVKDNVLREAKRARQVSAQVKCLSAKSTSVMAKPFVKTSLVK